MLLGHAKPFPTGAAENALVIDKVSKTFASRRALDDVSLTIPTGQMVGLLGPSGAGKSTLMRVCAGLIPSDSGSGPISVLGQVLQTGGRMAPGIRQRRAQVGFIFQQFNLVGRLTLLTNVLTGTLARTPLWRRLTRCFSYRQQLEAMRALHFVGMADYASQRASTLSGGQQQRGAVARAIVQQAKLILADEPIASLDPQSARVVMQCLRRMNQEEGVTVVVSVHQVAYATNFCDRVIAMKEGALLCDCPADALDPQRLREIYGGDPTQFEHPRHLSTEADYSNAHSSEARHFEARDSETKSSQTRVAQTEAQAKAAL